MADGRAHQVLAVAVTFFILSWLTMGARMWVRAGMINQFGRDDWAMLVTQVVFTIYLICQLGGVVYGTGQHLRDLEAWRAERALLYWFFCELFYALATVFMKVAIGMIILRVAVNPVHVWIVRCVLLVTVVFGGAYACVLLFQCWPIHVFWTLDPNDGHCINSDVLTVLTYTISVLNICADWILGLLPVFVVKDLPIPFRRKAMVSGILAFAAIGSTATIVRMPYVKALSESSLGYEGDFLYDTTGIAIWTTVEVGVGISAGCIATLRPLHQFILQKLGIRSSQHQTSRQYTPSPFPASRGRNHGLALQLDGLPKGQGVVTTITGRRDRIEEELWSSRSSSQERLDRPNNVTKHVLVECGELERELLTSDHNFRKS